MTTILMYDPLKFYYIIEIYILIRFRSFAHVDYPIANQEGSEQDLRFLDTPLHKPYLYCPFFPLKASHFQLNSVQKIL